jgi:hypothetical protein
MPLLAGCPIYCDCGGTGDAPLPVGTHEIAYAPNEAIEAGLATIEEGKLVFSYTDDDGNEWEIEYALETY